MGDIQTLLAVIEKIIFFGLTGGGNTKTSPLFPHTPLYLLATACTFVSETSSETFTV